MRFQATGCVAMGFVELTEHLGGLKTRPDPSELHGLITGWMCAGSHWVEAEKSSLLIDWIATEIINQELTILIQDLADMTLTGLGDIEFGFQLLVPDDEAEINQRQRAISLWCGGFLSGFGVAGRFRETELNDEVSEVLGDFARIAGLDEEIPENEENETDLMEISEYVRLSALLVFTECAVELIH